MQHFAPPPDLCPGCGQTMRPVRDDPRVLRSAVQSFACQRCRVVCTVAASDEFVAGVHTPAGASRAGRPGQAR
jgi:hypothetical protein